MAITFQNPGLGANAKIPVNGNCNRPSAVTHAISALFSVGFNRISVRTLSNRELWILAKHRVRAGKRERPSHWGSRLRFRAGAVTGNACSLGLALRSRPRCESCDRAQYARDRAKDV